jgi:hypothetical protein
MNGTISIEYEVDSVCGVGGHSPQWFCASARVGSYPLDEGRQLKSTLHVLPC